MLLRLLPFLVVLVSLTIPASAQDDECLPVAPGSATIRCNIPIAADTLLYIENQDVARLFVNLNGNAFKLAADPTEVAQSGNAFPFPREGALTINIGAYMQPENNSIEFTPQGPSGSSIPRVIIANVLLQGQTVAYAIEGLEPLPQQLDLLQSYPNPFAVSTRLVYTIPEDRITGVPVRLTLYDVIGRRVRTLVDGQRYPGTFTATWDGTGADGSRLSSGLYFAQFVAGGDMRETVKLTLIR